MSLDKILAIYSSKMRTGSKIPPKKKLVMRNVQQFPDFSIPVHFAGKVSKLANKKKCPSIYFSLEPVEPYGWRHFEAHLD